MTFETCIQALRRGLFLCCSCSLEVLSPQGLGKDFGTSKRAMRLRLGMARNEWNKLALTNLTGVKATSRYKPPQPGGKRMR